MRESKKGGQSQSFAHNNNNNKQPIDTKLMTMLTALMMSLNIFTFTEMKFIQIFQFQNPKFQIHWKM